MHAMKISLKGIAQILVHISRTIETVKEREFSNENIDKERTALNYDLCDNDKQPYERFKERFDEIYHINREDIKPMVSIVITLPKDYNGEPDTFFKNCKEFYDGLFGKENCIVASVHMDEKTPHMHYGFIPVVPNLKRTGASKDYAERLNAKKVMSRERLRHLHPDLQKFLREKEPDKTINIINGEVARKGQNLPVKALKLEQKERDLLQKEQAVNNRERAIIGKEEQLLQREQEAREKASHYYNEADKIQMPESKKSFLGKEIFTKEQMDELEKNVNELLVKAKNLEISHNSKSRELSNVKYNNMELRDNLNKMYQLEQDFKRVIKGYEYALSKVDERNREILISIKDKEVDRLERLDNIEERLSNLVRDSNLPLQQRIEEQDKLLKEKKKLQREEEQKPKEHNKTHKRDEFYPDR